MSTFRGAALLTCAATLATGLLDLGVDGALPVARAAAREVPGDARYGREPAIEPSATEKAILERIAGGAALRVSPSLVAAARALARGASAGAADPLAPSRIRAALAGGLSFDPAPVAYLAVGPHGAGAAQFAGSMAARRSDTHAGVGVVVVNDRAYVVGLVTSRRATLEPFPRQVALRARALLRGTLLGLHHPAVHVTDPSGVSAAIPTHRDGPAFTAPLDLDVAGRWTIEVIGDGSRGPEVAAILTVWCGVPPALDADVAVDAPDPLDLGDAEERVVAAINALRARFRLAPVRSWPALARVAREHSDAMLRAGVLAHRLPGSDGPGERLRRARIAFAAVLENVAKGPSGAAAHRLAEESPAHRQNILSPDATRVGVGLARGTLPGGEPVVYLTELFVAPATAGAAAATPSSRDQR